MVGCWRCTHPSIHFFRLKITVGCLTSTYPSIHIETPSRSRSVVWCVVWCVVWWCVCVVCEAWHTLSFSLVLSPSSSLSLSFSLLSFFFSLLFLFLFSLAPSLTLALALVLSLSLLSSFFPSTHSSLLFPSRQQTLYKALINKHSVQL